MVKVFEELFFSQSACEEDRFQCGKNGICIPNYVDGAHDANVTMAILENLAVSQGFRKFIV